MTERSILRDVEYFSLVDTAMWTIDDPGNYYDQEQRQPSRVVSTVAVCERSGKTRTMLEKLHGNQQTYGIQVVAMRIVDVMNDKGKEYPYQHIKSQVIYQTEVAADSARVALEGFRDAITKRPSGSKK